jgi:ATP-dependent DNA ligase
LSRNLKNITSDLPEMARQLGRLGGGDFILDGEIAAFDRNGVSRFQLLQRRELDAKTRSTRRRVFADWLRNAFGQTIAAPYSVRRHAQALPDLDF